MAYPDCSFSSFDEVSDDSKYVYEDLARLGFSEFSTLQIPDMQVVLSLAQFLKRTESQRRTLES